MNIDILEFLMEHDVIIKSLDTRLMMTADAMYELGGEFVVFKDGNSMDDIYRGTDFEEAMEYLEGQK